MPLDLAKLVAPAHTALVTQELQRGVMGDLSQLPDLAKNAGLVLPNMAKLVEAARAAGATIVHCVAEQRADGRGGNSNARIFQYMAKTPVRLVQGSDAAAIVPEIAVHDSDVVLSRLHGLSPFQGTELDFVLRNLGVTTIVAVGVSVNVAIQNFAFDAVNSSYQMVIPRDAVAGFPPDYVEMVFAHTLGAVATLVTSDDLLACWSARPSS
jgi:nicotinamidase-related amidase